MRSKSHPDVWALGDCAEIPCPDGTPYPYLAQHAMREAATLAQNLYAELHGKPARPFIYETRGMLAALGHHKAFARVLRVRLHGFIAWWCRRTYYLFVMPKWARRTRIVFDWTIALLFRPDTVKVDLESEIRQMQRGPAGAAEEPPHATPALGA